ncbi:DUF2189 domain-containing protein [Hydrogenophaga sp.]|uniref:DUF2189 domain-containing protein n=1 Tax=Hydrogenophaga sp. TaxID=1904254 RepID=UPI0019907AE6|nr:DUF2189 domain-containing protein [Hydrogenophaga sp.]MBD3893204.1 DUF2189 domain-containing protein [Hydrogenophaga sp.]
MNERPTPSCAPRAAVTLRSPLCWLARGWADLRSNPLPGLLHGLLLAAFGGLLLWQAGDEFWLLAGAFSGFLIVAPILVCGLLQISRSRSQGQRIGIAAVLQLWRSGEPRLLRFGLLLGLAGTGWVLTSAALITLWSPEPIHRPMDFLYHVVLVRELGLFEVWLLLGALLAAPVFASTVVALPMLVDTPASISAALLASWHAVADHPGPAVLWAVLIALLVGLGMLTALIGLIVIVPWLAHASWHAYCDLSARPSDHASTAQRQC